LNVNPHQPYASTNLKGKTAFDVTKKSDSCLSITKKQSVLSTSEQKFNEGLTMQSHSKQQTKVMSINASDKGIEIAFKTNDVFSS